MDDLKGKRKDKKEYRWENINQTEFEHLEHVLDSLGFPDFPIRLLKKVFDFDKKLVIIGKDSGFNSRNFVYFLKNAISMYLLGRSWNANVPYDKNWASDLHRAYTKYLETGLTRFDRNYYG